MALILPEIKHEYIFKEDTEQQKESTFEQCLDEGKEAAYASIGTDPLDSTYIAAPDVLPDHIMEYTSTDGHDYLKTIELVWGYTIGIITTPVVLNADTGDILAEGNAVDSYTAPEGVNIKKGRWIRLSGNRNLHPSILRAVEMPEDVICLKDLCAAIQIDEKTGFTVEGFDSSHVINFDNAFQKAWINSEVTFDMSSCKTCKYMFNEGLIKDNSGELLTIQNMQPNTNCDYMFYNSYLYRIPEGIRQAGVGGAYMFCDSMLGRKSGLNNNTAGYKGILAERMFYQSRRTSSNRDQTQNYGYHAANDYTGMYNINVDTTDMVFTSCQTNISWALNNVIAAFPSINFKGVTDMHCLFSQYSGTKVKNVVDLSTIDQKIVQAYWFINKTEYLDELDIIGNPENTSLAAINYIPGAILKSNNYYFGKTIICPGIKIIPGQYYNYDASGELSINITNTLRLYEGQDVLWEQDDTQDEDGNIILPKFQSFFPSVLFCDYVAHTQNGIVIENVPKFTLKITGHIQCRFLIVGVKVDSTSNCTIHQSYFTTEDELKKYCNRFYSNYAGNSSQPYNNFMLITPGHETSKFNYDDLNLQCFNFDDVFFVDAIVTPINKSEDEVTLFDNLTIDRKNKPFALTRHFNKYKTLNINNASSGFICHFVNLVTPDTPKYYTTFDDIESRKTLININTYNDQIINIYYLNKRNNTVNLDNSYYSLERNSIYYTIPFLNCPNGDIYTQDEYVHLYLKQIHDINNVLPDSECSQNGTESYLFSINYTGYSHQNTICAESFNNVNTNNLFSYLAIPATSQINLSKIDMPSSKYSKSDYENKNFYLLWFLNIIDYDTLKISEIKSLPSFNFTPDENNLILLYTLNYYNFKDYPISYFQYNVTNGCYDEDGWDMCCGIPLQSQYTLKHDVDEMNLICNKYGRVGISSIRFYPSVLENADFRNIKVSGFTYSNTKININTAAYRSNDGQPLDYYIPETVVQSGIEISSYNADAYAKILNTKLNMEVSANYSNSFSYEYMLSNNAITANIFPNLTTINLGGYKYMFSLQYNPNNNHVENKFTTISENVTYPRRSTLNNIDLRWSQAISQETLNFLVDADYQTNSIVTINTIPYKLLTSKQIQTLSSKVTLNEYIPQEGEV